MFRPDRQFPRVLIFCVSGLFSLFPESYSFYKLSLEDGLSSNSVYRIEQDSTGYMWFGTFSGLNRYDGREIRTYKPEPGKRGSISSPVIFDLYEDSKERLWVATDGGGLNLYNSETDDFVLYSHDGNKPGSISSNNVYAICEDQEGKLWIGTGGAGLNLFNEESLSFRVFRASEDSRTLDSDVVRVIYSDSSGILWIGTEGGGLSKMGRAGLFENYRADSLLAGSISSDIVRTILEDSRGNLWIGTEGGGLNLLNRQTGEFSHISHPLLKEAGKYSVRSIREDREGRLWIGTEGQGIFIINAEGEIEDTIRHQQGNSSSLSKDKIRHIFIDRNGLMWIGTRDGGVNRYNPRTIGFNSREDRDIRAIYEDSKGDLWIGSDGGGLDRFSSDGTIINTYQNDPLNENSVSSNQIYAILEDSSGSLWIGTDGGGLNRFDTRNNRFDRFFYNPVDKNSLASNTVWSLLEDRYGTLWVGTEGGGLNAYDQRADSFHNYLSIPEDNQTLNGNSIRIIFEDSKANLWIGTWDGGLNLYDREKGSFKRFSRNPDEIDSLSDSSVNTIFEDSKGRLWIGTAAGGLNLMDRQKGTFRHFRTNEGIAGDNIFAILEDESGYLWISTDRGLTKFHPDTEEILNFGESDGLPGSEFSINAGTKLNSGELIFGGPQGINRFFPSHVKVNRTIPPVVITDVLVMNEPVLVNGGDVPEITLSYYDDILTLHFAVLDYTAPERNRYAVLMEGLHEEWSDLENQNSMVYNRLSPGEYVFRVKGADNNGIWNEEGAQLNIRVLPPWWKTKLFFLLLIFAIGALIYSFIRFRMKRLEEKNRELREYSIHIQDVREEERTWVAREVHDQLGQTLSALKMEIFRNGGRKRESMLDLVNMSLDSVKELSTRLRPKVLDNLGIGEAILWLVRDFASHTGISVTEDLDEKMVVNDGDIKTALFRISQEVLTNVIRHSGADKVEISLGKSSGEAELIIRDNGCGISDEAPEKTRSFGIRGIKERCRYLDGTCRISRNETGGTTVFVRIPLKSEEEDDSHA